MSAKGGKRISVFDRLGPGADEPSSAPHRRFSDKHVEKMRHSHPRGDEPLRERKASHQDYEEKKHLHYRESTSHPSTSHPSASHPSTSHPSTSHPSASHPSTSHPSTSHPSTSHPSTSHPSVSHPSLPPRVRRRHYHGSESDYSDGEGGGGRTEKKEAPRKTRELPDVPKESYHKRGGDGGGGGMKVGRGGKVRRGERKGTESGSENEYESGGEEGRRKRAHRPPEQERRPTRHSLEGGLPDDGRRMSKHLERKEKPHPHLERTTSSGLSQNGEPIPVKLKGELKEEREGGHHRRRREEEHIEPRHGDRKRKRELEDDIILLEAKKPRLSDHPPLKDFEKQRSRETDEKHVHGRELEPGDRKRRYEGREPLPRKRARTHSPDGGQKYTRPPQSSPTSQHRRRERERKSEASEIYDSFSETESTAGETSGSSGKKLDWSSLSSLTLARPTLVLASALDRFTPAALFAQTGVSPSLAGPELFHRISRKVSDHLRESQSVNLLPESTVENPFEGAELACATASYLKEQQEWASVFMDIGPCRRALTASVDFAMRRRLRKTNRRFLPPSQPPPSWDTEHYATGVALYQSLGKKSSGKPAFRVEQSQIGSLLIAR